MDKVGRKKIKVRPGHVVDYWANKYVSYASKVEVKELPDNYNTFCYEEVIPDMGEPRCMACGKYWSTAESYPSYSEHVRTGQYWKIWEYQRVRDCYEILHIEPWYPTNDYDYVDNLFLLCHECAFEWRLTDSKDKGSFLAWAWSRRKNNALKTVYVICDKYRSKVGMIDGEYHNLCQQVFYKWEYESSRKSIKELKKIAKDTFR